MRGTSVGPATPAVTRFRVVLVDDDHDDRELLREWLEGSCRFAVAGEASDGELGMAMVAELRPELVVLDLGMPGGDGVKALIEMVSLVPSSAVVVYSGLLSDDLAGALLRLGAMGCVKKSVGHVGLIEELLRAAQPTPMKAGETWRLDRRTLASWHVREQADRCRRRPVQPSGERSG